MNSLTIFFILEELSYSCHSRNGTIRSTQKDAFIKKVLSSAKNLRKDLSKEGAIEKGVNIYEKREVSIHSIIEHLVKLNLISIKNEQIFLLQKGYDYILKTYTDNNSPDYQAYRKEVLEFLSERNETEFTEEMIAKLFFRKNTLEDIKSLYFDGHNDSIAAYHSFVIKSMGKEIKEDSFIFHLSPQIFLPMELIDEKISLVLEGIDVHSNPIIGKPVPNIRYSYAGTKLNKTAIYSGFYPIITTKQLFPKEQKIIMKWNIGDFLEVIHKINIKFEFDKGNFFSTIQSLSRDNRLDYLKLVTTLNDDDDFGRNRNITRKICENVIHIEEDVTLTSFSMHLHASLYPLVSYQKFKEHKLKL